MVPLVEHDAGRALRMIATARRIDHHQCVIGDDQIRLSRAARGMFDKAFPVMRASGINAFAALIGQRCNPALAE